MKFSLEGYWETADFKAIFTSAIRAEDLIGKAHIPDPNPPGKPKIERHEHPPRCLTNLVSYFMVLKRVHCFIIAALLAMIVPALAGAVTANFTSVSSIPVTAASYEATGNTVNLSLGFAPSTGTDLTVVKNTGLGFIIGEFSNLAQGQVVNLSYGGNSYRFVANYYGGTGNDLVMHWAYQDIADWGYNSNGQLGNNSVTARGVPVLVTQSGVLAGKIVVSVSAGDEYSLARCSDGTLVAWGYNSNGQLGNNSTTDSSAPVLVTKTGVLAGKTVVSVATGAYHSLALCSDGTLVAWGANWDGELGNNSTTDSSVPVLVTKTGVLAGKKVVSVSAGCGHSLALCSDGTVAAWGWNGNGQLGNNSTTDSSVPVLVTQSGVLAGKTVVSVASGYSHSLALCSDGTVAAWGYNGDGELGDNSTTDSSIPVLVTQSGVLAGKTVVSAAAGAYHSLALCSDGTVAAWGYNGDGELGNNSTTDSSVPVLVTQSGVLAGKTVISVAAGQYQSLALCSDSTVAAWGYNGDGELGNNSTTDSSVPVLVTQGGVLAGKTVVSVAAGYDHSLALCSDGTVGAWGWNNKGDLGSGTTQSNVPVLVTQSGVLTGKTMVSVAAGDQHSLALCSDGTMAAWGGNDKGELGNNSTTDSSVPVLVTQSGVLMGKTVVSIAAGGDLGASHSLALCNDGTVAAWGSNGNGELGNDSTTDSNEPVLVTQSGVLVGKTVVSVAAGASHSLALCSDGTVAAWGSNGNGELGNDSTTDSNEPVLVTQSGVLVGKTVVSLAAGASHSLALCSDGTMAAWGVNGYGELGNDMTADSSEPVMVTQSGVLAGKTVVSIAAGHMHSLALCTDGTLVAWGYNSNGQLGNNSTTDSSVPVLVTKSGVLAGKTVVSVAAGGYHSLALCSDGTVVAWGSNGDGELGNNSTTDSSVPVLVTKTGVLAGKTVVALAAGTSNSMALVALPNSSNLSNLTLSSGTLSPTFAAATISYTASVSNATSSVTVTPTLTDATATIKVNGTTVASGTASGAISLSVGSNTITTVVTAQDGTTTKTYTVTVTRAPSAIATLSGLVLSSGTLSPMFAAATISYTARVPNTTTSITVTPTVTDATATIKVNGTTTASGVASGPISLSVGANIITTVVTAQDGTTTKTYTVTVTRAPSAVATLSGLILSSGTLSPTFAALTTAYTASVSNATTSITVTPTITDATATIKVNGTAVASGTASGAISLSVGTKVITTVVTAQDGTTTKTYTVTVTRVPSAIATLSGLVLSSGTLSPTFTSATMSYTASVPNATTSITVKPTVTDTTATIKVNGTTVASGVASGAISLSVGTNTITTVVTAQDGITQATYAVTVTRAPSAIATLSGLVLSSGTLSPTFAAATISYTASVPNATTSITVKPTVTDATATIKVNGTSVASGTASGAIPLSVGSNVITTVVTAQDGISTTTYTLTVMRISNVATLSGLVLSSGTLNPTFAAATISYTASVTNATTSITVTPTVTDAAATIKVNGTTVASGVASGSISLTVGTNTITTVVTAQDGTTTKTYTLTVTRVSNVATLSGLVLSSGTLSPAFATVTMSYTASVPNATTSITVKPTVTNTTATIKVNGTTVASGVASGPISLSVGNNVITTVVTAQDGTTISTYTVTVTRISNVATLTGLVLSSGTLSPPFAAATTSYTASVTNATNSITVTPTATDATATIKVNGMTVASGVASGSITLTVGTNTISMLVTAQDGTTVKTYTVTVTRALSPISTLSALVVSTGTLSPSFSTGTLSYTSSASSATTSVTVTPTVTDNTSTVKVNGTTVASGSPSAAISLGVSSINTITVLVTAQNGTNTSTYTVVVDNTPYGIWKKSAFNSPSTWSDPTVSGDSATPGHDGISNMMKYALGLAPMTSGTANLPTASPQNGYLTLSYRKNKTATDVTYVVQAIDELSGNSWVPATTVVSQIDQGDHWQVTVRDTVPYAGQPRRFMRLQVAK